MQSLMHNLQFFLLRVCHFNPNAGQSFIIKLSQWYYKGQQWSGWENPKCLDSSGPPRSLLLLPPATEDVRFRPRQVQFLASLFSSHYLLTLLLLPLSLFTSKADNWVIYNKIFLFYCMINCSSFNFKMGGGIALNLCVLSHQIWQFLSFNSATYQLVTQTSSLHSSTHVVLGMPFI